MRQQPNIFVGFKVTLEDRQHLDRVCAENRINLSNLIRVLVFQNLDDFGKSVT